MAAYECTEAGDWGSLGDNTIRCTGADCTMAGFYTADQAGTATLLAATNCAKAMTLTYQIRPTDQRALQITFTIASKTAETDYIWITGTDAWGTTLYECIDIAAGNGAYTSTQYFRTITQIDIEDVGDGSGTAAADGTVAVTQPQWGFVWELVTSGSYRIDGNMEIGDGSTATTLTSLSEMVRFDDTFYFTVETGATLEIGELHASYGRRPSFWSISGPENGSDNLLNGGNLSIYASIFENRSACDHVFDTGVLRISDSILTYRYDLSENFRRRVRIDSTIDASSSLENVFFTSLYNVAISKNISMSDLRAHDSAFGFGAGVQDIDMLGTVVTDTSSCELDTGSAGSMRVINPDYSINVVRIQGTDSWNWIKEIYTVNIHVTDKDGNNLSGVDVTIQDIASNTVSYTDSGTDTAEVLSYDTETELNVDDGTKFGVSDIIVIGTEFMQVTSINSNTLTLTRGYYTTPSPGGHKDGQQRDNANIYIAGSVQTQADGTIPELKVVVNQWQGSEEILTTYNPHKITISKAGYETLILENITIDSPIDWHLELQPYGRTPNP